MSPKVIVIGLVAVVLVLVGGAVLITSGQKPDPAKVAYSSSDQDRPRAEGSPGILDLGEMKVTDVGQKDFTLKNSGAKPLQILNVNSSCNCTFAQVIYNGQTSQKFGMHSQSGFVTDIAPGDSATVRVIYNPSVMPVYGTVEREVYITTNDPQNSKVVFAVKAFVK